MGKIIELIDSKTIQLRWRNRKSHLMVKCKLSQWEGFFSLTIIIITSSAKNITTQVLDDKQSDKRKSFLIAITACLGDQGFEIDFRGLKKKLNKELGTQKRLKCRLIYTDLLIIPKHCCDLCGRILKNVCCIISCCICECI